MAGPWDNVQLPGPPQAPSYMAPQIGMQLGALLGNLPQDYLQGIQQQQQIRNIGLINQLLAKKVAGASGDTGQSSGNIYGDQSGAPPPDISPTASADPRGKIPVIMAAAQKYGVDPRTAVAVARSEGLAQFSGDGGKSGGAFQLYTGGGLGNDFQKETGLDPLDPKNEDATIDWAMRNAARTGWKPYNGAKKIGITGFQGIGQQTASTDPNFVPQQGAQPAQASAESAQQPGAPTTQVAQAAPQQAPQGGASAAAALVPQQWRRDPRGYADWLGNRANQLRKQADDVESSGEISAGPLKFVPKAEGLRKAADDADATRSRVLDALKQEAEPTGTMKEMRAQGSQTPVEYEATKAAATKGAESDVAQYGQLHKGLAGAGMVAANGLDYTRQAKALINDPAFYSGTGEGVVLGYKRALSALGIDPGASVPQEAFRKVMAANVLQQVNALKAEADAMGDKGGRIFASQIDLMEKAAQNPDNSVQANRYLTEVAERSANRTLAIANQADDYKKAHGNLDAGFEKGVRNWIVDHPLFTAKEMANPRTIGAPKDQQQAPQGAAQVQEGATATNPKTGERMIFQKGKWSPLT